MRSLQFMPLRSLAYQQGYTQSELASAAGLAPSTMNARLQGRSTFRAEEMQRLGRLLGIDRRTTATTLCPPRGPQGAERDYGLHKAAHAAAIPQALGAVWCPLGQQTQSTRARPSTHNGAQILPTPPPGQILLPRRRL